jgi:hypothetical protein
VTYVQAVFNEIYQFSDENASTVASMVRWISWRFCVRPNCSRCEGYELDEVLFGAEKTYIGRGDRHVEVK